jgi:hypothetical protein
MCVFVHSNAILQDLDNLLRREWCECANHLSIFIDQNGSETSKKMKIIDMGLNGKIRYDYDTGSTNTMFIELISINSTNDKSIKKNKYEIVFRNEPFMVKCKCVDI